MSSFEDLPDRIRLQRTAHRVMIEEGLNPDFSPQAMAELAAIHGPAQATDASIRDLRSLLWCSIDNDDSRDLDQLSVAEALPDGAVKVMVAIADVDALVKKGSAIDAHARENTTSVYTVAAIFPMLPEKLSTDLTSLGLGADRLAIVADMTFARDGSLEKAEHYRAIVHNRAKLAYDSVGAWLEDKGPMPAGIAAVPGLDANLRLQDEIAQKLRGNRHRRGALDLETVHARPIFEGANLKDLVREGRNRAHDIIEDLMIAANTATARFLAANKRSSIRRIVKTPKHWDRIVGLAAENGATLPQEPDSRALEAFLVAARKKDHARFPDLSLSVIKLLGSGEYVLERPGGDSGGHFGLAIRDYAHSTAPNRRYPDVITQRLLKAAMAKAPAPYRDGELQELATHCTEAEDDAKKVERAVAKCGAALLLRHKIGQTFDAIVTGVTDAGAWVRILHPPAEGKLLEGAEGAKVGDAMRVQLMGVNLDRCFIDFRRA